MFTAVNLPRTFDAPRPRADLAQARPEDWAPHFNRAYYEGDWSARALRLIGGLARRISPAPEATDFRDTPHMARFPYFHEMFAEAAAQFGVAQPGAPA